MLWEVWYECLSGEQFIFNYYCHYSTLVIHDAIMNGHLLHIQDEVTQGYPLSMIAYGIVIPPTIR